MTNEKANEIAQGLNAYLAEKNKTKELTVTAGADITGAYRVMVAPAIWPYILTPYEINCIEAFIKDKCGMYIYAAIVAVPENEFGGYMPAITINEFAH